jgi:hypothetical protein
VSLFRRNPKPPKSAPLPVPETTPTCPPHELRFTRTRWGQIQYREPVGRYKEFWHVYSCACGAETKEERDEYYGDDMDTVWWR